MPFPISGNRPGPGNGSIDLTEGWYRVNKIDKMGIKQDSGGIIRRLKSGLGVVSDEELADILGVYTERILFWRKYNTLDYELIVVTGKRYGLDLNFLFSHNSSPGVTHTEVAVIPREHQFEYASGGYTENLVNRMPRCNFSFGTKAGIRAFEATAFSLFSICKEDSYVIGEFVGDARHLEDGNVYVIVNRVHGICIGKVRLTTHPKVIYLVNDDRRVGNQGEIAMFTKEIAEFWKVDRIVLGSALRASWNLSGKR